MALRKKILILHASAGHGHAKAARALYEGLQGRSDIDAEIVDALDHTAPVIGPFYRWVYMMQIKYSPWTWAFFYYSTDTGWIYPFIKLIRRCLNGPLSIPLHKFLEAKNPDVIITTHFLSTEVTSYLKSRGRVRSKLVTVVTDYMPHYVWTAEHVDFYAVASEETKAGLIARGVAEDKIRVTGIPIEKKFTQALSREALVKKFGLTPGVFTVLVTSGGAGIGAVGEIAEKLARLKPPVQVLFICGTNRELYDRMSVLSREFPSLKVFGFVDNMQELMEVSDLVVGKGGGLTVTESFAMGKPLILFRSVPGQEKRNDTIVRHYGAGFPTRSVDAAVAKAAEWADNPALLERVKEGVKKLSKPDATQRVLRILDEC